MRIATAAALAALIVSGAASATQAQAPRSVELPAKAAFKHRHSKVQLPPVLAGLPRVSALEYETDQLDTMSSYATADLGEVNTVYIYRRVAGDAPVWFDRARQMLEHRAELGTATLYSAREFAPPGRANASGLLATYATSGQSYRSTGVALVPVGEWLVKLRASSRTLAPGELEARMKGALEQIVWPKKMVPAPAAAPVASCATSLALSGEAKPAEKDDNSGGAMMFGALLGQMGAMVKTPKQSVPPPVRWCRDSIEVPNGGIYRADEQTDRYLIALSDAGRAISVGPAAGQLLIRAVEEKEPGDKRFEVQLISLAQTMTSGLLDRLPPPSQAIAIVKEGRFATSFGTWGKGKGEIKISSEALK